MNQDQLAYIHNKKATLTRDRVRWLNIIDMLYCQYKTCPSKELKEMMKFCGEQSQEIKFKLTTIK